MTAFSTAAREVLELADKATAGPWNLTPPHNGFSSIYSSLGLVFGLAAGGCNEKRSDAECEANAALIILSRTAAPLLARAYMDLLAAVTEWTAALAATEACLYAEGAEWEACQSRLSAADVALRALAAPAAPAEKET